MNEVIYRGIKISTTCKYFQVKEGNLNSITEDRIKSVITLTYSSGSDSSTVANTLNLPLVGESMDMLPTGTPKKFTTTYVSLNGLKLRKLTYDPHIIHLIIVSDSESRVCQSYNYTTVVVSESDYKNPEFINFLFFSGNLNYLRPIGPKPSCYEIRNFPRILIDTTNTDLTSTSETLFTLRRRYDDYVIRAIDYQDQAILEFRSILEEYGVELVRVNKEKTLTKTSYISYQFMQTPVRNNHPDIYNDKILPHKLPIEFTFRSTDMVMYFDFKNKYNNVDLLTNFCEFKTTDKYGDRWSSAIKWGPISEDFNHIYQLDDNSNYSWQCQFRCELFFYEVIDDRYKFLEEINYNLSVQ